MTASPEGAALKGTEWAPAANPWMIAASVMLATFMVVLDTSVANVALPHIAGNLSASTDEATWILTSYLVSNAIMLPASGWIARRIGRKRLLLISVTVFTAASVLCGAAVTMPMIIFARVLQGIGGGGMQPLSQSIMLESFAPHQHGKAMAAFGVGVVVAPVIGPTLGGWITDSYSWRWIFYINLPVGLLALLMVNAFVEDPPYLKQVARGVIDFLGFGLMALWLGSLQLLLDKGQEADWFSSDWIVWAAVVSTVALVAFIVRELTARDPIVQLRVLRNRNFAVGTMVTLVYGFVLYGLTAMMPLFLQTLLGYPALESGLAMSPRGVGAMVSMVAAGVLTRWVDSRVLLATGFTILAYSTLMLSHLNLEIAMISVAWATFLTGVGMGLIFVPLTTTAMSRLRQQEMGNAAGIYNLMRNIGGSIGIAIAMTLLVRNTQQRQSHLVGNVSAGSAAMAQMLRGFETRIALGGYDAYTAHEKALAELYKVVQRQASLLAYVDNFQFLAALALLCIPMVLLFARVRHHTPPAEAKLKAAAQRAGR